MFKTIYKKITDNFSRQPRWFRAGIVFFAAFFIISGIVLATSQTAQAIDWPEWMSNPGKFAAQIAGNLALDVAAFLAKLITALISALLAVIQNNDFMNEPAINTAWGVLRDVCNLFFVLILLTIAFGTILRIENYKYNKLLGHMVVMIVLVNFSRMISMFFIDISQVVVVTFANAISDVAAGNFVNVLQLKEFFGIDFNESSLADLGYTELFWIPLFGLIMMLVAFVVIVVLLVVFVVRIVMLWILVVLSPAAWALNVLPLGKEYAKRWWSTFGKWLTVGPVLVFLIWFSFLIIQGQDQRPNQYFSPSEGVSEESVLDQVTGSVDNPVVVASKAGNPKSILNFVIGVVLLGMSLGMAGSLGGMAGGFAGKASGMLTTMGTAPLKAANRALGAVGMAPLKGAWEVTKAQGRRARRGLRDRVPPWMNVAAVMKGAKQIGKAKEDRSIGRAEAQGRQWWARKSGATDIVPALMAFDAKQERAIMGEVQGLEKSQKAGLMEKNWDKGGYEAEIQRRGLLLGQASEAHIDDALETDFFMHQAKWKGRDGKMYKGFGMSLDGKYMSLEDANKMTPEELKAAQKAYRITSNSRVHSDFVRAVVSTGKDRSAATGDITSSGARTLHETEDLLRKAQHYEGAGEAVIDDETKELVAASIEHKNATFLGEIDKPTARNRVGMHPHNFSEKIFSEDGDLMRIIGRDKSLPEYQAFLAVSAYAEADQADYLRFSAARQVDWLGKFDKDTKKFKIHDDPVFLQHLKEMYQEHGAVSGALEVKQNSKGFTFRGKDYKDLNEFGATQGWAESTTYRFPEKKRSTMPGSASGGSTTGGAGGGTAGGGTGAGAGGAAGSGRRARGRTGTGRATAGGSGATTTPPDIEDAEWEDVTEEEAQRRALEYHSQAENKRSSARKLENEASEMENFPPSATDPLEKQIDHRKNITAKREEAAKLINEAEKLDKGETISNVHQQTAAMHGHLEDPEVQNELKNVDLKENIEKLSKSFDEGVKSITEASQGLDLTTLSESFSKSMNELRSLFEKLPEKMKGNLPDSMDDLGNRVNRGDFKTQGEQLMLMDVLKAIRNAIQKGHETSASQSSGNTTGAGESSATTGNDESDAGD